MPKPSKPPESLPRPFGDRVIVKPVKDDNVSAGGIALPDNIRKDELMPNQGTVVAVGPGKYGMSGDVLRVRCSVGDRVLYHGMAGVHFDYDGVSYVAVGANDLLVKLP